MPMSKTRRDFAKLALAAPALLAAAPARAQSASKLAGETIKFYIGAAPGGPSEVYARVVGTLMSQTLGATIVYEVRPGANGVVAAQIVRDAPADGRSAWIATQSMIEINPYVYADLHWKPEDFLPLIKGVEAPLAFVVNPQVPAKTLAELVAWAKANKGKLSISSYSPGTPGHFLGVQMNERFGLDFAQVNYRGSAPQVTDALGGQTPVGFFQTSAIIPHVQTGALRVIAVTGSKRFPALPDAPTFTELGYPDFLATVWYGILLRTGTPPDLVAALLDAAKKAHADPQAKTALTALGMDVVGVTGQEFSDAIKAGQAHWSQLVKQTGFRASE